MILPGRAAKRQTAAGTKGMAQESHFPETFRAKSISGIHGHHVPAKRTQGRKKEIDQAAPERDPAHLMP
jgi:hypothetical protein